MSKLKKIAFWSGFISAIVTIVGFTLTYVYPWTGYVRRAFGGYQLVEAELNGTNLQVTFIEGGTPDAKTVIKKNNAGVQVPIPKGCAVVLKGEVNRAYFYVPKELRPRVIDQLTGGEHYWRWRGR